MNTPLLQVCHLFHEFPNGFLGLNDVSLTIGRGEFIVLAGPNGSGKTLLMRHLNGLLRPSSGEVKLDGIDIVNDLADARRRIGLVFQEADAQIVGQTVGRDAAFGPENLKLERTEINRRVGEALEAAGLTGFENRRPHTLSGGEKRRLAVAGVMAMRPELLVLDEPFTGLDWPGSAALIEVLLGLNAAGSAILVITHDLEKLLAHAGRLILMKEGGIHADGHPCNLLDALGAMGVRRPHGDLSGMTWRRS